MVKEIPDRDFGRELPDAAGMVLVLMRDKQVIDLVDASVVSGSHDAIGVAILISVIPCVDQHRLAGG